VKIEYRWRQYVAKTTSLKMEFQLQIMAVAKSRGVAQDKVKALWCEDDFVGTDPGDESLKLAVDDQLLKRTIKCRLAATDMLSGKEATSTAIEEILGASCATFHGADPFFAIEEAMWNAFIGQNGQRLYLDTILAALPKGTVEITLENCLKALDGISSGKLHQFVGVAHEQLHTQVKDVIVALKMARVPTWPSTTSPFITSAKEKAGNFFKYEASAGSSAAASNHFGKDALTMKLKVAKDKAGNGQPPMALGELLEIRRYDWVLSAAEFVTVSRLIDEASGAGTASALTGPMHEKKAATAANKEKASKAAAKKKDCGKTYFANKK